MTTSAKAYFYMRFSFCPEASFFLAHPVGLDKTDPAPMHWCLRREGDHCKQTEAVYLNEGVGTSSLLK